MPNAKYRLREALKASTSRIKCSFSPGFRMIDSSERGVYPATCIQPSLCTNKHDLPTLRSWHATTSLTKCLSVCESLPTVRKVSDSLRRGAQPLVSSLRWNSTVKGLPACQNQCLPGAGIRAMFSPRSVVSKSTRRIRLTKSCSRNHSFTHTNAASSFWTVIIMVAW